MSGNPVNRSFSCDEEIEERLRKLKSDKTEASVTDQKAIEERLARLKGIDPNVYSMPPITVYQQTKQKTDVEKTDDLIKQLSEELNIDELSGVSLSSARSGRRLSTDEEIERRLARLRGQQHIDSKKTVSSMDTDSDLDEETEQNNLIERLLSETNLPSIPSDSNQSEGVDIESDCLPWCVICNEDAVIKCVGCMDDLYCKQCFVDFHDDSDLKRHKTEPFRQPKSRQEF